VEVGTIIKSVALFAGAAYAWDVLYRPKVAADQARAAAAASRKPMLNIGAGTPNSSLAAWLGGAPLVGDVNMDLSAPAQVCLPDNVCAGDVHSIPFPDKHFGSALASHVVEHVDDPAQAMRELHRVADEVFIIVPVWWAPHTWLHPGHQWRISQDLKVIKPLWKKKAPPALPGGRV
jgi:SAM-dependent methyltransferase